MRFSGVLNRMSYSYGKMFPFLHDSLFTQRFQERNPTCKWEGTYKQLADITNALQFVLFSLM